MRIPVVKTTPVRARPVVLLLAAGASRRFGQDKRQALLYKDKSLLCASLEPYLAAGCDVRVCLCSTERDDVLARELEALPVRVLRCERAQEGMGGTLAEAAREHHAASYMLVALADMPLLRVETIRALLAREGPEKIVVPVNEGRRGHPVLFGRRYLQALSELGGDRGAAPVLAAHPEAVCEVPIADPGIHRDADTPEALAALRALIGEAR